MWLEANKPGDRPARLPNAKTPARLADVCKGDSDRCAIIHISGAAVRSLKADDISADHLEDWAEAVEDNRKEIAKHVQYGEF